MTMLIHDAVANTTGPESDTSTTLEEMKVRKNKESCSDFSRHHIISEVRCETVLAKSKDQRPHMKESNFSLSYQKKRYRHHLTRDDIVN